MSPQQERQRIIDELAAKWFSRLRAGADERERQAWRRWLAEDAAHERAYRAIESLWDDFDLLPRPALAPARRMPHWRGLATAAAVLAAVVLGAMPWGRPLVDPQLSQASAPGEQRELRLADGSRLFLAGDSAVRVDFSGAYREVRLLRGEAYFEVAHDSARPFRVRAGDSRVRVVGTRFDLRLAEDGLQVAVNDGKVALQPRLDRAQEQPLVRGDLARVAADGALQVERIDPARVADWRDGLLRFRERPLGELVEELSRYRSAPIRLGDPRLARRQLSGSVRIARLDDFLAALPALADVRVRRQADGSALILPR
ncbi:FecR family protein [Pseudomonas citronellolis]|uniref:FecR family protein n=1 Tax=Pseudomonas citronellolis TaxID=53408 RepID=UPI002111DF3D|nr:FecR family protein [Pseudomonas citronellolis]UUC48633.1 FecR family protein [Pseudomonas citronellolis]